jgi:hypothetical protein
MRHGKEKEWSFWRAGLRGKAKINLYIDQLLASRFDGEHINLRVDHSRLVHTVRVPVPYRMVQ